MTQGLAAVKTDLAPVEHSDDWKVELDRWITELQFCQQVGTLSKLRMGRALYYLRNTIYNIDGYWHKLYQAMYDKWSDFLASPEIDIAESTARNLIAIWKYQSEHTEILNGEEIMEIGHRKMSQVLPKLREAKTPEEAKKWVDKAKELSSNYLGVSLAEDSSEYDDVPFGYKLSVVSCPKCDTELICPSCGWGT